MHVKISLKTRKPKKYSFLIFFSECYVPKFQSKMPFQDTSIQQNIYFQLEKCKIFWPDYFLQIGFSLRKRVSPSCREHLSIENETPQGEQ